MKNIQVKSLIALSIFSMIACSSSSDEADTSISSDEADTSISSVDVMSGASSDASSDASVDVISSASTGDDHE